MLSTGTRTVLMLDVLSVLFGSSRASSSRLWAAVDFTSAVTRPTARSLPHSPGDWAWTSKALPPARVRTPAVLEAEPPEAFPPAPPLSEAAPPAPPVLSVPLVLVATPPAPPVWL